MTRRLVDESASAHGGLLCVGPIAWQHRPKYYGIASKPVGWGFGVGGGRRGGELKGIDHRGLQCRLDESAVPSGYEDTCWADCSAGAMASRSCIMRAALVRACLAGGMDESRRLPDACGDVASPDLHQAVGMHALRRPPSSCSSRMQVGVKAD